MPDPTRRRTLTGSSGPVLHRAADRDADPADGRHLTRTTPPPADLPAAKRHPGRPAGQGTPRVALYARILPATDQQLAQAVQRTSRSKQDIVEEALQHWLDQHPPYSKQATKPGGTLGQPAAMATTQPASAL